MLAAGCYGTACAIYGTTALGVNAETPNFILNTDDAGSHWSAVSNTNIHLPTDAQIRKTTSKLHEDIAILLRPMVCLSAQNCLLALPYEDQENILKTAILHSNADRTVWDSVASELIVLPLNASGAWSLTGMTCANAQCIAVGSYSTVGLAEDVGAPLILKSTDSGASWSAREVTLPAGDNTGIQLLAVQCQGLSCKIMGSYASNAPLLWASQDGGTTWSRNDLSDNLFPDDFSTGTFTSISLS